MLQIAPKCCIYLLKNIYCLVRMYMALVRVKWTIVNSYMLRWLDGAYNLLKIDTKMPTRTNVALHIIIKFINKN